MAGLAAFFAGICLARYSIWEDNPLRPWYHWLIEVFAFTAFSSTATGISIARENFKLSEGEELIATKALLEARSKQLGAWINTSSLIREIIKKKQAKLLSLKSRRMTRTAIVSAIWDKSGCELILQILHGQFRSTFTGNQIRVSLFSKADKPFPHLMALYSYDGTKRDCISVNPEDFRLDTGNVAKAEVAKHYLQGQDQSFQVVEDCSIAANFCFFRVEERSQIRSMLTFKHHAQGLRDALILSVDCDQAGFFNTSMTEGYKHLIVEMMHRLEYQLLVLQVRDSLRKAPRRPK